jgi:molybdate transport system substrate-binding protein
MGSALSHRIAVLALCAIALFGCRRRNTPSPSDAGTHPHAAEIRVAAASSLGGTLEALGEAFARTSGTRVVPIFGATGTLARQIQEGLPVDVFMSADNETPARLAMTGYLANDTVAPFARGVLVLYARPDAPVHVTALAQLNDPAVQRIAIANPEHAPFGRAAREALTRVGRWDVLSPRVVMAENVREAFEFARTGNADVAFTAQSVTMGAPGTATPLDPTLYSPIDESLGVVSHCEHPDEARAFVAFVRSAPARAILSAHGFAPVP